MNALTGYLLGGVGLAVLALGGWGLWLKADLADARTQLVASKAALQVAVDANKQQTATIAEMKRQEGLRQQSAVDLQAVVETVQQQSKQMDDALAKLEKANTDVRTFLNAAVPPDVQCLLANKPAGCHLN